MVLLLPLLIPRMLVIVAALLFMATCSYIGGLGWCVGFAMRTKRTLYRTRGLIEKVAKLLSSLKLLADAALYAVTLDAQTHAF